MQSWAAHLEHQARRPLESLRLGDLRAQALVDIARNAPSADALLDRLARRLVDVSPRDWADGGEAHFYRVLQEAKAAAEQEVVGLAAATEGVVEVQVRAGERFAVHRFRRARFPKPDGASCRTFRAR